MTTQATTPTRQGKRDGGWLLAGMTALTVSAILAALLWQLRPASEAASPRVTTAATAAAMGETSRRTVAATTPHEPFSLVLVADEQQAAALAHEYESLIDPSGRPALDRRMQVIVVRTPEDLELAHERLGTLQMAGEKHIQVFDLRQPATRMSPPSEDPAVFSDDEMYSRWLQAQAAR